MVRAFFAIRSGERRDTWTGLAFLFGFLASHSMLETARDALFLSKLPASRLPWVYLGIAGASLGVTRGQARLARLLPGRAALVTWTLVAAAGTVVLWWLLRGGRSAAPIGSAGLYALYGWSGVLTSLVLVHLWSLLGDIFSVTQAKRLYGLIGAGSVVGAIVGSGAATALSRAAPPDRLLLVAAAGFAATAALPLLFRPTATSVADDRLAAPRTGLIEDARFVATQPYASRVALLLVVSAACLTVADYLFKATVAAHVPAAKLGQYFAAIYFVLNIASLVCQVVLVRWLLRRFDLSVALAVLPALLLIGGLGLATGLGLVAALFVRGADGSLRYSLHRTSTELLFVPLGAEARRRVRGLLEIAGQRGGQAIASIGILAVAAFGAPSAVTAGALMAFAAAWVAGALDLKSHYLENFRGHLREGRIEHAAFPELDVASLETLIATLDSQNEAEVIAALDVLERERKARLVPALILYHPADGVVERALRLFTRAGRKNIAHVLERLLEHPSVRVRSAAVAARAVLRADAQGLASRLRLEESPEVRATIVVHMIAAAEISGADAERQLEDILQRGSAATKVALAHAIASCDGVGLSETLVALATAVEPEVRRAAAHAMADRPATDFLPVLLDLLADERTRAPAQQALRAHGADGLAIIRSALSDGALPQALRWQLPKAASLFDAQEASTALLAHLPAERDGMVRYRCIRALEGLVARHPTLAFDRKALRDTIDAHVSRAYRYFDRRLTLELGASADQARVTPGHKLLLRMLRGKEESTIGRLFRLLGLAYPTEDFAQIWRGLKSPESKTRASSVELVENVLEPPLRGAVVGLIDDLADRDRLDAAGAYHTPLRLQYEALLERMLDSTSEAVQDVTAFHVAELGVLRLRPRIHVLAELDPSRADLARAISILDEVASAGRVSEEAVPC